MNIVEMKMMDEYYKNHHNILEDLNINHAKAINTPTFYEKQAWLRENINYTQLMEFALDDIQIINILYAHFNKK